MSTSRIQGTSQAQRDAEAHYAAALRLIQKHKVSPRSMNIFNFRLQVAIQCEKAFNLNPSHPNAMRVWRNMVRDSKGEILSLGKRILWNKLIAQRDAQILYQSKHGMITYKTFAQFQREQNNQAYGHAMSTIQAQTTAKMQATFTQAQNAISSMQAQNKTISSSLDKMANINLPPQVAPTTTVLFEKPLYSLQDCHRSGGTPVIKGGSIYLAEAKRDSNFLDRHPNFFTGFNGEKCRREDICIANDVKNMHNEGAKIGAVIVNQIEKYVHQNYKWQCLPEHIQPSKPKLK